ncbi:hypothetical protein [Paraburkholderia azotifigens]|uniref:hypothetical protein n=1 Tax=Paraburkholderia azotifigens TaxID=2057004 RepID=UPI003CCC84B1
MAFRAVVAASSSVPWREADPLLLVARAFAGITGGVLASVVMAIVGDEIPVARRGAATDTIITAISLAAIVGVPAV